MPASACALDEMKQRLSRLDERAAKKRALALEAMTEVGLSKLEQPDFTASARAGTPSLVVISEDTIPTAYWLPQPPKLDRQALLGDLKRGDHVPGAQLEQPEAGAHREDQVMALTDTQVRQLRAKLDAKHVKDAQSQRNGASLCGRLARHRRGQPHLRLTMPGTAGRFQPTASGAAQTGQHHAAAYTAKVRVSVRAGDMMIVREGSGTGEAKASTPGQAHELALKGAETDATKRALATFGNPFGLALYDREQGGVTQTSKRKGGARSRAVDPARSSRYRASDLREAE